MAHACKIDFRSLLTIDMLQQQPNSFSNVVDPDAPSIFFIIAHEWKTYFNFIDFIVYSKYQGFCTLASPAN